MKANVRRSDSLSLRHFRRRVSLKNPGRIQSHGFHDWIVIPICICPGRSVAERRRGNPVEMCIVSPNFFRAVTRTKPDHLVVLMEGTGREV
jgi:hypothetical protein